MSEKVGSVKEILKKRVKDLSKAEEMAIIDAANKRIKRLQQAEAQIDYKTAASYAITKKFPDGIHVRGKTEEEREKLVKQARAIMQRKDLDVKTFKREAKRDFSEKQAQLGRLLGLPEEKWGQISKETIEEFWKLKKEAEENESLTGALTKFYRDLEAVSATIRRQSTKEDVNEAAMDEIRRMRRSINREEMMRRTAMKAPITREQRSRGVDRDFDMFVKKGSLRKNEKLYKTKRSR